VKFLDEVKGREDVDYFNIPEPKWHDCFFKTGDSKSGQVLCSFNIVSVDYVFQHHLASLTVYLSAARRPTWLRTSFHLKNNPSALMC